MAKKKKPVKKNIKNKQIQELNKKRKLLKQYDFIKQDLRKNPTPAQKAAITKQWNKYGDFLSGDYAIKKLPKTQLKNYSKHGHLTTKTHAFVNKEKYDRVYFGKDFITKTKKGKKVKYLLRDNSDFLPTLEETILANENVKNNTVMFTVGNDRVIEKRMASYKDFQEYLKQTFSQQLTKQQKEDMKNLSPKERKKYKKRILDNNEYVRNNIAIVTIDRPTTKGKKKNAGKKQKSKRI